MRLSQISENRQRLRTTAVALSELVDFIQQHGSQSDQRAIDVFLKKPTPQAWLESMWLVDKAIRMGAESEKSDELTDSMEGWAMLKRLTPPVVSAAVYDMSQMATIDTPRQTLAMNEPNRNRLKRALGPLGYVSTMAGLSELPKSHAKKFLKSTARHSNSLIGATKKDIPGTRVTRQF